MRLILSLFLFSLASAGQALHIVPSEAMARLEEPRRFVLLDSHGQPIPLNVSWSASVPSAEISANAEGVATATFHETGTVQVLATYSGKTVRAPVTVVSPDTDLKDYVAWDFAPLGGKITKAMRIPRHDVEDPDIFYEDAGTDVSLVRAFFDDGTQAWAWPPKPNSYGELLAGASTGGVLSFLRARQGGTVVRLSADGKELWRRKFSKKPDFAMDESLIYFLLEDGKKPLQILAVEERTGLNRFNIELPSSTSEEVGFEVDGNRLTCRSELQRRSKERSSHSRLFIPDDSLTLALVTERRQVKAECSDGEIINASQLRYRTSESLNIVRLTHGGTLTVQEVETVVPQSWWRDRASTKLILTGGLGPDNSPRDDVRSGLFVAIRRIAGSTSEDWMYRIASDNTIRYKVRLGQALNDWSGEYVLGEFDSVMVHHGNKLVVFHESTGAPLWTWHSKEPFVIQMSTIDGGIYVARGDEILHLKDGEITEKAPIYEFYLSEPFSYSADY